MRLKPGLAMHLGGIANELLVNDYPGATISHAERELLATAVSAGNDCFYRAELDATRRGKSPQEAAADLERVLDATMAAARAAMRAGASG